MTDPRPRRREVHPSRIKAAMPEVNSVQVHGGLDATSADNEATESNLEEFRTYFMTGSWVPVDPVPDPDAETLLDALMSRVMAKPYSSLDPAHNASLLRIFESYRLLADDKHRAEERIKKERKDHDATRHVMRLALTEFDEEVNSYKQEIKRLELIISKSKQGLAAVARARQDSLVKRRKKHLELEGESSDGKESLMDFLEKSHLFEDRGWSTQRATMRQRPVSPSRQERRLSKQLSKKTSKLNVKTDLPPGAPPQFESTTLTAALSAKARAKKPISEQHFRYSIDSSENDAQSEASVSTLDENDYLLRDGPAQKTRLLNPSLDADLLAMKGIAERVCVERGVDSQAVVSKLLQLLEGHDPTDASPVTSPFWSETPVMTPPSIPSIDKHVQRGLPFGTTHHRLKLKASGLLQKMRPQASAETLTSNQHRRFSFEHGDDKSLPSVALPGNASSRSLRKSMSLTSLGEAATRQNQHRVTLSPVPASPTASSSSHGQGPVNVSTPSQPQSRDGRTSGEGENSTPSLTTIVKHSQGVSQQRGSPIRLSWSAPLAESTRTLQDLESNYTYTALGSARAATQEWTEGTPNGSCSL